MPWECLNCGLPNESDLHNCLKCDTPLLGQTLNKLTIIDIAHNGESWADAQEKIDNAISTAIINHHNGLKIIHGKGTTLGHTKIIRNNALPFLKARAKELNCKLVEDKKNKGAHIIYFSKKYISDKK